MAGKPPRRHLGRHLATILALVMAAAGPGSAVLAETPADFDTRALAARATAGDAVSALQLGTLYYVGNGVVQDYLAAVRWLGKSADGGNAEAACELGLLYQSGSYADTPPNDPKDAASWYAKSAAAGDGCGSLGLAALYRDGDGVVKDAGKAATLFAAAASQGFAADRGTFVLEQINRHFHALATSVTGTDAKR